MRRDAPIPPADMPRLVLRAQLGERAAMEAVLRSVQGPLGDHLRRILGDRHLAEDLLQEVLWQICRKIGGLAEPRAFEAWAFRIATRAAFRAIRRRRRDRDLARTLAREPGRAVPVSPAPEPHPDDDELERLWRRIEELPPNTRAALSLHYGAGLSISAAAAVLGIPVGTAKSRVAYGLSKLRAPATAREEEPA